MPRLPQQLNVVAAAGGQWGQGYTLTNDDGSPVNLSAATFEFVIRPEVADSSHPALVQVASVAASAQGYISVSGNTLLVVLAPAATTVLGQGARPYALWMDAGLTDATPIVAGTFFTSLVPLP